MMAVMFTVDALTYSVNDSTNVSVFMSKLKRRNRGCV